MLYLEGGGTHLQLFGPVMVRGMYTCLLVASQSCRYLLMFTFDKYL